MNWHQFKFLIGTLCVLTGAIVVFALLRETFFPFVIQWGGP